MSDLFKDMNLKTRTKDSTFKAKATTKDSGFVLMENQRPRPRTTSLLIATQPSILRDGRLSWPEMVYPSADGLSGRVGYDWPNGSKTIVTAAIKFALDTHITPVLRDTLHWLPVTARI